jgi:maltoporin
MQTSEVLNDKKAVLTHLKAMQKLWAYHPEVKSFATYPALVNDKTKEGYFAKKGMVVS